MKIEMMLGRRQEARPANLNNSKLGSVSISSKFKEVFVNFFPIASSQLKESFLSLFINLLNIFKVTNMYLCSFRCEGLKNKNSRS